MHKLTIHPSTMLKEENTLFNTIVLTVTTLVLFLASSILQQTGHLALFWPLNAVLVGLFLRFPFFNRPYNYLICLLVLLLCNAACGNNDAGSVLITLSNMLFVVILAKAILKEKKTPEEPLKLNVLRLYSYCLMSALISSLLGSYGFGLTSHQTFLNIYSVWFSEQFSTSVLVLPFLLTWNGNLLPQKFDLRRGMPLGLLILSITASANSGGIGSLAVTLPALIWCAISYSLPVTCLLTQLTGIAEVLMVDSHWMYSGINGHITQIVSARMGIASVAISPVMVAVSVQAINMLVKQLSARANYDFLTRVHSRFGLYEKLRLQDEKTVNTALNVLLLDIDHFKSINDTHGHDCGDSVLTEFARRVKDVVGDKGIVARMGGEEFAVVMPDACGDNGYLLAEEIRAEIEQMEVNWEGDTLSLTVSIGLSHGQAARRQLVDAFDKLLSEADRYLYQSKKAGRNRTSAAPAVMDKLLVPSAS
ncbi:diguanylate cyclase [Scandinavium sp. H11S7]|uniref:GGDEF domain-containing protein n=1 Tax=Scandinavium hiltneri TaxID=2926519 RepID=UPI0021656A44|nr:sensor domain-containing diguanylate cyclase [Scandinavium hiltneri]MCS2157283.1 diguanylate cyclase [Scandinavium hiltneri]